MRPERSGIRREHGVQTLDVRPDPINRALAILPAVLVALLCPFDVNAQDSAEVWIREIAGPQYFAVQVQDVDRSVRWYRTALGLEEVDDSEADDGAWRIVNLANEDFAVEIIYDRRAQEAERPRGFFKVGFGVPDVEAVADRVERAAGERPRIVDFEPHGIRLLQLQDPDGNIVQLSSPIAESSTRVAATDLFEFHSDPWINLHHFLYQWSREEEGLGTGRRHVPVPERSSIGELSPDQREAWLTAVAFYRDSVAARDHFDPRMLVMNWELQTVSGRSDHTLPDYIPGIADALTIAMSVYVGAWWPEHDATNRSRVSGVLPFLERHEGRFVETTTRLYGSEWSGERTRVDVAAYANWAAGYTAMGHTVIYSTDQGNQGLYALETILHEVQHARAVGGPGRDALHRAFEEAGTEVPDNLWHALIFETAGTFVKTVAELDGLPEHVPYWVREKFEAFRGWKDVVPVVRSCWPSLVTGDIPRETAFATLAVAFGEE